MAALRGVRQRCLLDCRLSFKVVLLLQLFLRTCFVTCQNETNVYHPYELDALQKLWNEWNKSTPDTSSNLAGWSSSQMKPCESDIGYWRGVTCLRPFCGTETNCNKSLYQVKVIGLSLSNASLVGMLPDVFWFPEETYLPSISTLELIGNPNLTGPLPTSLNSSWLYVLDLHDNAFNGTIPNELLFPRTLQYLDLSGNQITGGYPLEQFRKPQNSLQSFNIGRNKFSGVIRTDAFQNKTRLQKIDISHNNFTEKLPDLSNNTELRYLDVSMNQFEGPLPNLTAFASLRYVNLGGNHFTGTLTKLSDFFNVSVATTVDVSNNELSGLLLPNLKASDLGLVKELHVSGNNFNGPPPDLSQFRDTLIMNLSGNQFSLPSSWNISIEELYLDSNGITGTLDVAQIFRESQAVVNISAVKLRVLSLMHNNISDVTYDIENIKNQNGLVVRLQGNPYCLSKDVNTSDAKRCFCNQLCYITPVNRAERRKIITISVTSSIVMVALIVLVTVGAILLRNRRYRRYLLLQFQQKFDEFDVKPTIYSYNELKAATRDFHEENKLGQGGYGAVYKGVLANGNMVAVKQLYVKTLQTGLDEFSNEVVLITGMKHRNLVNLKGCCLREGSRILVYEYVDNYDVARVLLGPQRQVVSWPSRLRICLGVAHGLHYLHALAQPRVIHRDIKASNILLDKNLEPKVADFGLALLFPDEESHLMTVHVAGTKGYLAPEYATLGQVSDKVDVYSFGVLCLEIISGRRNIDESLPQEQVYLTPWAWSLNESNKLIELVDPTLHLNDDEMEDVQRVIKIALLCIQMASEKRPTMARIVSMLQSDTQSVVAVLPDAQGEVQPYQTIFAGLNRPQQESGSGLTTVTEESEISSTYGFSSESQHILRELNNRSDVELVGIRAR
ncbi:hypothetical protein M758_7G090500 [Ceratodon purpureus]|uniref:Protein kinase domain-containing protein n=1 Tax=Ceratodon purpureus TaxID=3225 RepID=A0A8T0H6G6_CERPU|nr:hypothetical protein KC19_7G097200 [Ceratodon purpureus]KAG0610776.1 hypothetical protein M758_7G090500 [Ceratodon purpureus]